MGEIKKNSKFKNIDFKNKNDEKIIRFNKKMKEEIEKVKKQLSSEEDSIFYIDMIYGIDGFKLEITRSNKKIKKFYISKYFIILFIFDIFLHI